MLSILQPLGITTKCSEINRSLDMKGISVTTQSGRYTLSYPGWQSVSGAFKKWIPSGRYHPMQIKNWIQSEADGYKHNGYCKRRGILPTQYTTLQFDGGCKIGRQQDCSTYWMYVHVHVWQYHIKNKLFLMIVYLALCQHSLGRVLPFVSILLDVFCNMLSISKLPEGNPLPHLLM